MNEQLQQALAAILNKTMEGVEAGASFLQAELPDVVQQLLTWKLYSSLVYGALGALLLIVVALVVAKAVRKEKIDPAGGEYGNIKTTLIWNNNGDAHVGVVFFCSGAFFGTLFGIGGLLELMTAIQIAVAPKIYLIEYAASLAK